MFVYLCKICPNILRGCRVQKHASHCIKFCVQTSFIHNEEEQKYNRPSTAICVLILIWVHSDQNKQKLGMTGSNADIWDYFQRISLHC